MPCTVRDGTTFSTTLRPTIRLPEPGRIWIVVTPADSARGNCGSCGHTECSAQTCGVDGFDISFPSASASPPGAAYTPRCECVSMIPGVTNLPVPSITRASGGTVTFAPTATIFPSRRTIVPFWMRGPVAVRIVALRIAMGPDGTAWYVLGKGSAFGAERAPAPGG